MNKVTALLLLLIGLLQYRLWFGDGNVLEFQRLNDRITELRQEGAKRRERNAALEAEVMDLKQGLDAVEERARQDLEMIKEGEVFVQVIDPHHEDEAAAALIKTSTSKPAKEAKSNDAAKPHTTESTQPAKPKTATAKTSKPADAKAAPKKATAKPVPTPVNTERKAPKPEPSEPIEDRPSTFDID